MFKLSQIRIIRIQPVLDQETRDSITSSSFGWVDLLQEALQSTHCDGWKGH